LAIGQFASGCIETRRPTSDRARRAAASSHNNARSQRGSGTRRLIWLNPFLRYAGFEPKARGVRAMLPHVYAMRPGHNLESLAGLCAALAKLR
jgi:uncharacterized protein with von Willebrand factor type A (vWA) domain